MKKASWFLALLCIVLSLSTSCNEAQTTPPDALQGTLRVTVLHPQARAVEPADMDVSYYEISGAMEVSSGAGPSFGPVRVEASSSAVSHEVSVATGIWSVKVDARNSQGWLVGSGSAEATVVAGSDTNVPVTVSEVEGEGQLNINFTDVTTTIDDLTATVSKSDGSVVDTIDLDKKENIFSGNINLANGFYKVVLASDNATIAMDDAVRIYAGLTTQYNVTYDGEAFSVTTVDEIIRTPEVELVIPEGSVAANGKLKANVVVEGLDDYSISWTLDAKEIGSGDELEYDLSSGGYTSGQNLRLSVFVVSGNIIWSDSADVFITDEVELPETATITIDPENPEFGGSVNLSVSGAFPEGTAFSWTLGGNAVGANFTASTIGREIPVTLTAAKDGVEKVYQTNVSISPTVSLTLSKNELPENAYLDVTSVVGAPEEAVLAISVGGKQLAIENGRCLLSGISSGAHPIDWALTYNDETWSGTLEEVLTIVESKESEAPTGQYSDVEDADKTAFINSVTSAIVEPEVLYETVDGMANLDRTYIKSDDGRIKLSSYESGDYTFWGSGTDDDFEFTVKNSEGQIFKVGLKGGAYYLNGDRVDGGRPSDAVQVATDKPHFPAWLQGSYVGHINDTFYREGWSYLTFEEDDFTVLSYDGTSKNFTSMYEENNVGITQQWSNSTDYWECTLEGDWYGLTYVIRKTDDGITVDYYYIYGYDIQNDTLVMTAVDEIVMGGTAGFEIPDWAYGTFEGVGDWGIMQGIDATIAQDGSITMTYENGVEQTFDSLYGDISIIMQLKYGDTWDVTFDSTNLSDRDLIFYSVTRTEDGMSVICVPDIASGYDSREVVSLTRTATVPEEPTEIDIPDYTVLGSPVKPTISAPSVISGTASADEQLVYTALGGGISAQLMKSIVSNMASFEDRDFGAFTMSLHSANMVNDVEFTDSMDVGFGYYDGIQYTTAQATVLAGTTYHSTMDSTNGTLHFKYAGKEYTATIESDQSGKYYISVVDSDNVDCTGAMSAIVQGLSNGVNTTTGMAIYSDEELMSPMMGVDLPLDDVGFFNVSSLDMSLVPQQGIPEADFIASFLNAPFIVYGGNTQTTVTVSSPGLRFVYSYPVWSMKGPVIADGVKYYLDVTTDTTTRSTEGGIWCDGSWKKLVN